MDSIGVILNYIFYDLFGHIDEGTWMLILYAFIIFAEVTVTAVIIFTDYIITSFAVYTMAYKAGYDKPLIAFIPFVSVYLMHIIPVKEYSYLGMYKSYQRSKGFWLYAIVTYIIPTVLPMIITPFVMLPFVSFIAVIVLDVINIVVVIAKFIGKGIYRIDLYEVYMKENKGLAMALGIISIFVPLVNLVTLLVICRREPEFGYGNFYKPISTQVEE